MKTKLSYLQHDHSKLTAKLTGRILFAVFFFVPGVLHVDRHGFYFLRMPSWNVDLLFVFIRIVRVFELFASLGLLLSFRGYQVLVGWGLFLLLLAGLPVSIYIAAGNVHIDGFHASPAMGLVYLVLQTLLMFLLMWITSIGFYKK
jgi:uncharacterized membrane protein